MAIRLALCLVLGAAVTVGVAWTFATRGGRFVQSSSDWVRGRYAWTVRVPRDWPPPTARILFEQSGITEEMLSSEGKTAAGENRSYYFVEHVSGWPWPCLAQAALQERAFSAAGSQILPDDHLRSWWVNGLANPFTPAIQNVLFQRRLPLRPRWFAFGADVLVLTAPITLVWIAIPAVRRHRRRRRGLCVSCGYPRDPARPGPCPECGQ